MSVKNLMTSVSALAEQITSLDQQLQKKHGVELGLVVGSPAAAAYVVEARGISTPLENYLASLPLADLKKLVTLMYAGRDVANFKDAGSLRTFHDDLRRAGVHDQISEEYIRIMSEKLSSLPYYFRSVIRLSQELSIDPDVDLAHIV